jgi:hypothetical protein
VGDSLYQYYAVTLVDTILEQDTDNDGGVPAGSVDPDTMDQTWISCYTDYMGIEKILWTLPQYDAGVVEFVSPQTGIPIVFGSTVPISVIVANFGELILDSVNVMAQIAPNFSGNGIAILSSFAQDTVELTPYWTPADTGYHTIFAYTSLPQDQNPGNDTASVEVEIRGSGTLAGTVTDGETGCGLFCQINFYHQEVSNITPYAQTLTQMPDGNYTLDLMAGEYRAEVEPQIPYNVKDFASAVVQAGVVNDFNMTLTPAPVLLVDDDGGN